jgi:hypothetical protein
MSAEKPAPDPATITVAGVTFSAADVVSVVVKIDGRKIHIDEKEDTPKAIGFQST